MDAKEVMDPWDENARAWADAATEYGDHNKRYVLNPALFTLIGDVSGRRVLDAGCGEGYLSRLLAARGAHVVAVDSSRALLEIAAGRTGPEHKITYLHADLQSRTALADRSFDLVVSSMVLQDLPDASAVLGELRRVLNDDGRLIVAMAHPCFSSDGQWHRGPRGEKLFWRTDNYFHQTPRPQRPMPNVTGTIYYFHRTLTTYFRLFKDCGLSIAELVEPFPSDEAIRQVPGFANDLRMSHFLVFSLCKVR